MLRSSAFCFVPIFFIVFSFQSAGADTLPASTQVVWQFKTGGPVTASPVLVGNTLYVGSEDGVLYALDAASGKSKWQYRTPDRITSTVAVGKKTLVFESGNILYALDLAGKPKWTFPLAKQGEQDQIDPWDFHHASPVIHKGVAYAGSLDGTVVGVKLKNGAEVFKCLTGKPDAIRSTPVLSGHSILFGDWEGVFYSCDLNSGKLNWQYDTRKDVTYNWKNSIQTTPALYKGAVYFAGRSSRLYCLDAKTGGKKWVHVSPTDQWLIGGPVIDGKNVFIGSSDQYLFQAFDADNGKPVWQFKTDGRTWGTPYTGKHNVYFAARSLFVLNKASGKPVRKVEFEQVHPDRHFGGYTDRRANMHGTPLLYQSTIIAGSDDGSIYALRLND